jgi:hypothetical protein
MGKQRLETNWANGIACRLVGLAIRHRDGLNYQVQSNRRRTRGPVGHEHEAMTERIGFRPDAQSRWCWKHRAADGNLICRRARQCIVLACLALTACSRSEAPTASESRPRPIGAAPTSRGSIAANETFATRVCTVIRNTVAKAGAQGTSPMVVLELEATEVFQDPAELTESEAKIEPSALSTCPDDRNNLLGMVGHKSITEALQRPR